MKERYLLIAGCSHAAGSEIDGSQDSAFNRQQSFGNQLAALLKRTPINIASNGSSNQSISRSILEWFTKNSLADVMVLVAWTESIRVDLPLFRQTAHEQWNPFSEFVSETARDYFRVNMGYKGMDLAEQVVIKQCQEFMAQNTAFIEILSANLILQLQYYFKSHKIKYLMCNTMEMFGDDTRLNFYKNLIDTKYYYQPFDSKQSFYWKFKNLGYENTKAKYWHHDEVPHSLFAKELHSFYTGK